MQVSLLEKSRFTTLLLLAGMLTFCTLTGAGAGASSAVIAPEPASAPDAVVEPFHKWWYELGPKPTLGQWLALQEAVADAERRDPEAAFLAALAVMQGHYPGVETEEAVDLLKDSAESGYLPARTFVALFQISGVHPQAIPLDREAGAEALDATYEAGDAEAAYRLGIAHSEGSYGYPLDLRKATRYMEAALERGHRRGLFPLGFLRAESGSVEEGYAMMEEAADQGDVRARQTLVKAMMVGLHRAAEPDRAVQLMEEWNARGDQSDAVMLRMLARAYLDGLGKPASGLAIKRLVHGAATLGDTEAALMLADIFLEGLRELPPEPELGVNTLRTVADTGHPEASFRLARLYLQGVYVPRDVEKARELLHAAAEKGHEKARSYQEQIGP